MTRVKAVEGFAVRHLGRPGYPTLGKAISLLIGCVVLGCATTGSADYSDHAETQGFIDEMVRDHGFELRQAASGTGEGE